MSLRHLSLILCLLLFGAVDAYAEGDEDAPAQPAKISVQRWRFGVALTARGGALRGVVATVTVPTDWHDQRVEIVEKDLSPGVQVSYQRVEDSGQKFGQQMIDLL